MLLLWFPLLSSSNFILPEPNNTAFRHLHGGFVRRLFESSLEFSPSDRSHLILIKHRFGLVLQPLYNWLQAGEIQTAAICIRKKNCTGVRLAVAPDGLTPTDTGLLTLAFRFLFFVNQTADCYKVQMKLQMREASTVNKTNVIDFKCIGFHQ